ncbi:PREDICTED: odorant receptor coreceptor-like [Wasmannia auropunctata]|uniref:odorant receptor coreceptor-like n=1 Tax=Wasmannia auropunctata TaxID=64793 RepID=UPI0005EE511E|nr:PREDICTED: odorant receptor coreceptor-like [Wasmannia auropunctata]
MRSITEHVIPKYFFTSEKYFYFIVLHVNTVICIGGTTLVATGMMLVAYLKHVCGIFKIVSYRIEKAMRINMQENVSLKDELIIYKEIIYAVDIHRKAIKFSEFILSSFQGSHFCLIMVGVVCLSLNLYGISVTASLGNDIEQCLVHLTIVSIIFIYMFLANYAGQEVIDHNDNVYSTAYNIRWYVAPLHVQRLILFLLQRGSKAVSLNLGGMFVMSLELFATLTKASISYFTVVYSMQQ